MVDITAGIYTTIGVLSALYDRDNGAGGSGKGQFIDISLVDSQVTWLANVGGTYFVDGERPPKMGNLHPSITPYQPMRARDRVIIVAVGTERLWERFCNVLGVDGTLMRDPRFETNRERNRHRQELIPQLEVILAERDADAWVEDLVQAGVPAGPVNYPDQILQDEHLASRGMIVELEHPLIGLVRSIGNPIRMSSTGVSYRRHPPGLGEHNAEIRAEVIR
jgi:crotonobetainyl-CoA:carnitine CoA-transferase CaiB-like acyl-CoA transferase